MRGLGVNTQNNPDRHQQILAAVSQEARKLEARPDCENELSNPKFRKFLRMRIKKNSTSTGNDFGNSYWFGLLVVVIFLAAIFLTNSCLGL